MGKRIETVYLAGGCFWCMEATFQEIKGVISVDPGYSGGHTENPTYEQVCSGKTGHAETLKIMYDPGILSYREILNIFFAAHDPTSLNRQGEDVGTQYRSAIFFTNDTQRRIAEEVIDDLNRSGVFGKKIVTEVTPFKNFYTSEEYHKRYYMRNPNAPYCRNVIRPKVNKIKRNFFHYIGKD